jgi:hypothetical protein
MPPDTDSSEWARQVSTLRNHVAVIVKRVVEIDRGPPQLCRWLEFQPEWSELQSVSRITPRDQLMNALIDRLLRCILVGRSRTPHTQNLLDTVRL